MINYILELYVHRLIFIIRPQDYLCIEPLANIDGSLKQANPYLVVDQPIMALV